MKYLLITLAVQDGERRHDHRCLHTTNAQSIDFAAQRYAASFWGYGERQNKEDDFFWFFGEITVRLTAVIELTEYEYKLMSDIFGGRINRNGYFEIVHEGHCGASDREEIQIHAGENGNIILYQDNEKLGFIIDVYGQNDLADTMTVWEEDLNPEDEKIPTKEEIRAFLKEWGQKQGEITSNLGYPKSHSESDELLMEDYFFLEGKKQWYPKISRMYSEREQEIADYIRNNRDNY
jgi:hypothetical protein